MNKKALSMLLYLLSLVIGINVIRTWFNMSKRGQIIIDANNRLQTVKDENNELQRQLAKVKSSDYIEKEVRDKLNLGKEDETVIFLPTINPQEKPTPTPTVISENWKKWVNLFLK